MMLVLEICDHAAHVLLSCSFASICLYVFHVIPILCHKYW